MRYEERDCRGYNVLDSAFICHKILVLRNQPRATCSSYSSEQFSQ